MSGAQGKDRTSTFAGAIQGIGRFVFRFRDYLAPLGLVLMLVFTRPQQLLGSPVADQVADILGFLVAALGQALRATVIGYAYIVRGGANKRLAAPKLVCEGFYAHSRNPMYLGNFLLLTGLAVIYNSTWVYLLVLPLFYSALLSIVKAEENFLSNQFGEEYADYCRRTNRFFPRLEGLGRTMSSMRYDWKRVLRKEYGTTLAWLSAAFFLLGWESVYQNGYEASRPHLQFLLGAWAMVLTAWGTVRFLKKTRRLDS